MEAILAILTVLTVLAIICISIKYRGRKTSKPKSYVIISDQTNCPNLDKLKELIGVYVGIKRNIIISDPKFTNDNAGRAQIHEHCRTLNITSETNSVSGSPDKIIIITLRPISQSKTGLTERELNVFVRLAKLPIDQKLLCNEDLFLDRLDALDEFYLEQECKKSGPDKSPKKMFQLFLDIKAQYDNKLMAYIEGVRNAAIQSITGTDEYKRMTSERMTRGKQEKRDTEKRDIEVKSRTHVVNPYQIRLDDYWGISLDIIKANYSVLKKFHPEVIGNTEQWSDFISQFTDSEFLINSKIFRQEIMGKTNNKRVSALQKQVVREIVTKLAENDIIMDGPISNDEIITSSNKGNVIDLARKIKTLIDETDYADIWRIDIFCVRPIMIVQKRKFSPFIRKTMIDNDGSIDDESNFVMDFRYVPKIYWFQIMKQYCKKPLNDYDLTMSDDYGNFYVLPYPLMV